MKNNPDLNDRRKFIRIPNENVVYVSECDVMEELQLKERKEKTKGNTKDISAGGLLFELPKKFDMEKVLKIEITLPHWEKYKKSLFRNQFSYPTKPFLILGKVVRVEFIQEDLYDIGVSFVGIEEDFRELLVNYINDHLNIA